MADRRGKAIQHLWALAMAGNPFFVSPPDYLTALMYGVHGFDQSRKAAKAAEQEQLYKDAGAEIAQTGGLSSEAFGRLTAAGPTGAPVLTALATLGKADTTNDIKNLKAENASRAARGLPPLSVLDYERAVKSAGATKVNVNTGNNAFDTAVAKDYGDLFVTTQKRGRDAVGQIGTLDLMEGFTKDPNFYSGFGGEKKLQIDQLLSKLGIKDPNSTGAAEAFRALSNQNVIDANGGSLGAGVSNTDVAYIANANANLQNTPEGNREIIGIRRKLLQRNTEVAKLQRDYAKARGGRIDANWDEYLSDWTEKNPLFPQARQQQQATPGRTRTGVPFSIIGQ